MMGFLQRLALSECDRVGKGVRAIGRAIVRNEGRIEIGNHVCVRSLGSPVRLLATASGTLIVGDGAVLDMGASLVATSHVQIGAGVVVGPDAIVRDVDDAGLSAPVVIEEGVRIGARARIEKGVTIGRGAIVRSGAIVMTDVAPGSIVEGTVSAEPVPVSAILERMAREPAANDPPALAAAHASASPSALRLKALLVADFTIDPLREHLAEADFDGLAVDASIAPFDQVQPTLLAPRAEDAKPDAIIVWTRPERAVPSFAAILRGEAAPLDTIYAEVDAFAALVAQAAARFVFIPTWTMPPHARGFGLLEMRGDRAAITLARMNVRLADALASSSNTFVLDAQRWLAVAGDGGVHPKLWHGGKLAFADGVLREAALDVRAALRGLLGMARKLVVVDLDDTMWGGIVGDVGWEGLRLGGHDAAGEALVEFQRGLVALTARGIALAVASKNEEAVALEAMRLHPEMVIRPEMLAAHRIHWGDKAQSIASIAEELNLGLQSVVFLDDNPVERARVREALPEVYVPEWPGDFTLYPRALASLRCFDSPVVSDEDARRNAMYATERARTEIRAKVTSFDDWLASLDLRVRFQRLDATNLARATQLLNKTNQMNLRTRRQTESELLAWSSARHHEMWTLHVSDRLGDSGLTGLLGLARDGDEVSVEDYVLSCRVMGRRVEEALVWAAITRARAMGGARLVVRPIATKKNKPCLDFFARAALQTIEGGYSWSLAEPFAPPKLVSLEGISEGGA